MAANAAERSRALLEEILRPVCGVNAATSSARLIDKFGCLSATLAASKLRLQQVLGSELPAEHLKAVHLGMRFALRQTAFERPVLSSSQALFDYLRMDLAGEHVEQLRGLYLDARNCLLADVLLARGTIGEVALSPREVVRIAIELSATAVILLHNHPSGDPTPSVADIAASKRVAQAAAMFDIRLHDHLIVGSSECVSLAALGLLDPRST